MKSLTFASHLLPLLPSLISAPAITAPLSLTNADGSPVPCETALQELRSLSTATPPAASNKAKFEELQAKGVERCNAYDDKRADESFGEAITMLKNNSIPKGDKSCQFLRKDT